MSFNWYVCILYFIDLLNILSDVKYVCIYYTSWSSAKIWNLLFKHNACFVEESGDN